LIGSRVIYLSNGNKETTEINRKERLKIINKIIKIQGIELVKNKNGKLNNP